MPKLILRLTIFLHAFSVHAHGYKTWSPWLKMNRESLRMCAEKLANAGVKNTLEVELALDKHDEFGYVSTPLYALRHTVQRSFLLPEFRRLDGSGRAEDSTDMVLLEFIFAPHGQSLTLRIRDNVAPLALDNFEAVSIDQAGLIRSFGGGGIWSWMGHAGSRRHHTSPEIAKGLIAYAYDYCLDDPDRAFRSLLFLAAEAPNLFNLVPDLRARTYKFDPDKYLNQ